MKNNKKGFSVILAILMTGFMIIITSGIFLLVLGENKDTKAMEYYYKSLAGANGALELAMLKAKKFNYSYDESIVESSNLSKVLFGNSTNYKAFKDVKISYDLSSITTEIIDKEIAIGDFDIIPLFSYDSNGTYKKVTNVSITGINSDVVWNIVGNDYGISGVGTFVSTTLANYKTISGNNVSFDKKSVGDFLNTSEKNYLILHNLGTTQIKYSLKSLNSGEYFTKDKTRIIATGEVGGFKQNIKISIDSSKYLNLLKYSIFSN